MKKRSLSLLLALVLCFTLMPGTVSAANTDFVIENGILKSYTGPGGVVVIPSEVTAIQNNAFYQTNVTEVIIPDGVTEIPDYTFINNKSLERVTLGKGVTKIGNNAFADCSSLRDITIPEGVTLIDMGAFRGCSSLTRISIPDSVTHIEQNAFAGCSGLEDVSLGAGLTTLGAVFWNCTGLTEIVIPENIRFLDGTFSGCTSLERVVMADTTGFSSATFLGCSKLPEDLTSQEQYYDSSKIEPDPQDADFQIVNGTLVKYRGNVDVKTLTIPDGVVAIGSLAFVDLKDLTTVDLNGVLSLDPSAFSNCPALTTVKNTLTNVDPQAFKECPALEHFPGCQDQKLNDRLSANEQMLAAWSKGDPQMAIMPQSKRIMQVSNQICAGYTSDHEKVNAVYDWVTNNIVYDYDHYEGRKSDVTILPEEVLDSKLTVCDGYSRLTQALLQAQNIPALRIAGQGINVSGWTPEDIGHAWNLVYVDGRWIYLDTTWGSPSGGNSGTTDYNWFDPTSLNFAFTHKAETSHINANGYDGDMTPNGNTTANKFTDVAANAYYADAVTWAVEKDITSGTTATTFAPDTTCTRAQILTFLWRANGSPVPTISDPFSDVPTGAYYADAAVWAYEKGLISGAVFAGDTPATRAATVTYLWKLAGGPNTSRSEFSDVPADAEYADAVAWAVEKGITSGTSQSTFSPDTVCDRAQIVTFLFRAYSK